MTQTIQYILIAIDGVLAFAGVACWFISLGLSMYDETKKDSDKLTKIAFVLIVIAVCIELYLVTNIINNQ